MRGRGRPPRRRGLRQDPPEHQAMTSREDGDTTIEPNPSMPMPYGFRDFGTNLPIENGTVPNYSALPPGQIAQTNSVPKRCDVSSSTTAMSTLPERVLSR